MNHGDTHRTLEGVLDREIDVARSLAAALDAERAALTGDSVAAVTAVAAQKIELFGSIEKLEEERRELCDAAQISLPNMRRGRTPVITGVSPTVAERWCALLELIAGCRIANEVNGYIINARRGQVGQLLQIIRGGAPATYGPQGKPDSKLLRVLARA
jgi:flagellar biosynthesis/type III secretory pathway chaperone